MLIRYFQDKFQLSWNSFSSSEIFSNVIFLLVPVRLPHEMISWKARLVLGGRCNAVLNEEKQLIKPNLKLPLLWFERNHTLKSPPVFQLWYCKWCSMIEFPSHNFSSKFFGWKEKYSLKSELYFSWNFLIWSLMNWLISLNFDYFELHNSACYEFHPKYRLQKPQSKWE